MKIYDLLNSTQTVAIILICYLLFFVLFYIIRYLKKNNEDKIRKYTFEFCVNDKANYTSLISKIQRNDNKRDIINSELFDTLSHFEKISIGVKNSIFDEKIITDYYARYFLIYYKFAKYDFLLEYRNNNKDPFVFIEFEKLANKWSNKSEWRD